MISFQYNGQTYIRNQNDWVNEQNEPACAEAKAELDQMYADSLQLDDVSVAELIAAADSFAKDESYYLAARYYREAILCADIEECKYIYPRLASCLCQISKPRAVINLMTQLKDKFGPQMIAPAMLAAVADAYCDLREYDNAKIYADMANTRLHGDTSPELMLVYQRIRKESGK